MQSRLQMPTFRRFGMAAGVAAILLMAGCSDSSAPRSVLTVTEINNNAPLSSDVRNFGTDRTPNTTDDFVVEDQVAVEILSEVHDDALDVFQSGPFGHIFITNYEIRYESEEEIEPVSGSLAWTIPVNSTFVGSLPVVPVARKAAPPLSVLVSGGEIIATAHITLRGKEKDSNAPVKIETQLPVHFANWVDGN